MSASSDASDYNSKFNSPATHFTDERAITGKGAYDLSVTRNDYHFEEDYEEVVPAKEDSA